ncbi:MAG: hypothetical protein KA148_11965, partial [Ottowia sp.]|nr:hypothetical protein [Ottowia sp.]
DHHLLPSGHLNSVNFHRVTLHCVFEVSPLEIGGFGAVPPSPPGIPIQEKAAFVAAFSLSRRPADHAASA